MIIFEVMAVDNFVLDLRFGSGKYSRLLCLVYGL